MGCVQRVKARSAEDNRTGLIPSGRTSSWQRSYAAKLSVAQPRATEKRPKQAWTMEARWHLAREAGRCNPEFLIRIHEDPESVSMVDGAIKQRAWQRALGKKRNLDAGLDPEN